MKSHAQVFFKNTQTERPLEVDNIFKITIDQKNVEPKNVSLKDSETIALHCSNPTNSVTVLKGSEVIAIKFIETPND
ncbi:hypothetical protein GIX82_08670 [Lactobacillus reuteri]|nr:hypothetical protein [Limosilactobacillus reuteri]